MAIKIKNLERIAKTYTQQDYIYKDLNLDLAFKQIFPTGYQTSTPGNDLTSNFDLGAIKNSLLNLFNTLPGQRFLFPEYGLDLNQFLFLPVTEDVGQIIGEKILAGIERFEPRIEVIGIEVLADSENSLYEITIVVEIPILKQRSAITGAINTKTQTFTFFPTSRNQ